MSLPDNPFGQLRTFTNQLVKSSTSNSSDTERVSQSDDSSSVIESVDSDSSEGSDRPDTEAVVRIRPRDTPDIDRTDTELHEYSWPALSAMRGVAEFMWHGVGRVINASCFILLSTSPSLGVRVASAVATGSAAGYCSYRMVVTRTGDSACNKVLAGAAGLVTGAAAGTAMYIGSGYPGLMIAAGGVAAFGASYVQHAMQRPDHPPLASAVPPFMVVATCGASVAVAVCTPTLRVIDIGRLDRRALSVLAESVSVELIKARVERMIPGADLRRLSFERKLKAALIGLLPYAVASIALNGIFGNMLRAQMKSDSTESYLAPLLVGALASVIKGMVNTAVYRHGGELNSCGSANVGGVRAADCHGHQAFGSALEKAALRYAIASARDVIYLSLIDSGMDEMGAACLAYALYAFFAQYRDLMYDMMQGEGWTEPRIFPRTGTA
jgi:hypothetical protein